MCLGLKMKTMLLFFQSGAPTSPIGARRRGTSGSQGAGQKTKQTERLTAAQQLGTTVPPPHQVIKEPLHKHYSTRFSIIGFQCLYTLYCFSYSIELSLILVSINISSFIPIYIYNLIIVSDAFCANE